MTPCRPMPSRPSCLNSRAHAHKTATAAAPISRPTHTHTQTPTHTNTHPPTHPHACASARAHARTHTHTPARMHAPRLVQGIRLQAGDGRGRTHRRCFTSQVVRKRRVVRPYLLHVACYTSQATRRMLHVACCTSHAARRMLHGRISSSALVKPAAAHRVMFRAACGRSHVYSEAGTACCMHLLCLLLASTGGAYAHVARHGSVARRKLGGRCTFRERCARPHIVLPLLEVLRRKRLHCAMCPDAWAKVIIYT
jgi:hypothetical protein